ncbi:MAG: hypothetical protein ACC742_04280 [Thermoanaerobaculales bacterium]
MLTTETIRALFVALNDELASRGVLGEVGLCGGAVMCLVFQARSSTKDVDAVFEPTREIREAAAVVARDFGVAEDWLNDAAKGFFISNPPQNEVMELPNLRVWAPAADYMLAMKCVSARFDSHDRGDVEFLVRHLELQSPAAVFEVICRYYPRERVPAKTAFFVEEILQG